MSNIKVEEAAAGMVTHVDNVTPRIAELIAGHLWSSTPLGARSAWPAPLRITVDTMLASLHPMCLIWGPERILLYNDGYAPILGTRHPGALGRPTIEVWPELWYDIEPLIDRVFAGESVAFRDQPLTMTRNGFPEETWYDFAYSPVRDDAGKVVGLLNVTSESTVRVNAQRDRDRTAVELSTNDAKWRELFETLEEGFILGEVVRDQNGRIVDWRYDEVNNAWYDLLGVERGCAVGRTVRELFPGIEDEWVTEIARVVETGEAIRFTRQVGDLQRWYDGICQPAGGDRFTVLFLEVTNRIRSEQRREALAELGRVLPTISDPDDVVRAATAIIGSTLDVGRVGYGTVAEDGETFTVPNDWTREGYPSLAGAYRMDDYGGYAEDLRQGRTVVIPDIRLDPRTSSNTMPLETVAVRSLVNRPIVEKGRTVAVLYVNVDAPRDWTAEELAFIADAANRTRAALERRRAEQEARETASFMRSVLAASTDCIKVVELDGTLSFMSDGGMEVMEISDFNAVRGCPWPDLLRENGSKQAREALEAAKRGVTTHFETPADTYLGTAKHWSVSVSPIPGPNGEVARILSVSRDHTELQKGREQQQLLNGELAHRIKNTMSVVQAIANQTLGKAEDQEAVAAFGKRLGALASAHDALTHDHWSTAKLGEVARGALETFGEDRFTLAGPEVTIGPRATLALTLMLHELATNAAKYGALTVPDGTVAVNWAVRREADQDVLHLSWAERDGPPAVEPTRKGFGSRIIRMGLSGSGGVKLRYETQGLTMEATAPLYQVQEA
ncbi:PAS domain-containing protein [Sphingomonas sp. BK069]|uniref:PAS domain-containing sensor histidine kinase n=1 Tax=Sphingomonas sp. BK069 TaxID=2586979 RepID=UPI00160D5FB3|nr:PAS domain-containing protein [Sphingomonas sp. BK069]MBB3348285.1 two-component sensor histidine kinase [Sphingomonas sp. BK069]